MTELEPMSEEAAAWVRANVWTERMRRLHEEIRPGYYSRCECQRDLCLHCTEGRHGSYSGGERTNREGMVADRSGVDFVQFPEPYKHLTPDGSPKPTRVAQVWLADRVCRWRCGCECHDKRPCRFSVSSRRVEPGEESPATVEHPGFHLRYWFRCECGVTGPLRSRENSAAEDGADHAYPGWRDMPVMSERPREVGRARARWEKEARRIYPAGWFERGGPVREYRRPSGTRHVPGFAPGGGYSMAVVTAVRPSPPQVSAPLGEGEPLTLF